MTYENVTIDCSIMPFLAPYLRREFGDDISLAGEPDGSAVVPCRSGATVVVISSAGVYGGEYVRASEDDATVAGEALDRERAMTAAAEASGARRVIVLRAAPVVATGMTGYPRRLAGKVASGLFIHVDGADGRRSVVHATDLARAARLLAENPDACGVYNVGDGADPTEGELADALAARLGDKRIFRLKASWARCLLGRRRLERRRCERTLSIARLCAAVDFRPVPVTEYLRTHVYDSSSL